MTAPAECGAPEVILASESLARSLESAAVPDSALSERAGSLKWTCRETLAHVVDCLNWYAANLARRSTSSAECPELPTELPIEVMVGALRSGAAVLAAAVRAADEGDRGWHPFGIADRSGFAAMGCDEVLVHAWDLAAGLGFDFQPPADVAERTLRRLFPWAPPSEEANPWDALLWANGRQALGERKPETGWLWHCAPLEEWNGEIRRRKPRG